MLLGLMDARILATHMRVSAAPHTRVPVYDNGVPAYDNSAAASSAAASSAAASSAVSSMSAAMSAAAPHVAWGYHPFYGTLVGSCDPSRPGEERLNRQVKSSRDLP